MAFDVSNDIQKRVERSIYHAIRKLLVVEGYLPAPNPTRYSADDIGRMHWETDLKAIAAIKNFAVEPFGHSSIRNKELKRIPRIVIIPRRQMPGDIGTFGSLGYEAVPDNPDSIYKTSVDYHSTNLFLDINLISQSAEQDRFLHYIINKAVGVRKFIPLYDNPEESFLIEQFNYYDLPNDTDNIDEKAYSYKIPDIWLYTSDGEPTAIATINRIDVDFSTKEPGYGSIVTEPEDTLVITLPY